MVPESEDALGSNAHRAAAAPAPHDLTEQLGILWRTMRNGSSVAAFREWLYTDPEGDVDEAGLRSLLVIGEMVEARVGALADRLSLNPSSVSRMVVKLEADGLVQRRPDPADHRSSFISVTDRGQHHLDQYVARARQALGEILSVFTPQEQMDLASQLTRFVESVDKFMERD